MKKGYIFSVSLLVLLICSVIWWKSPVRFLRNVENHEIHSIAVRSGNTGRTFSIDDPIHIGSIADDIRQNSFDRHKFSITYAGTLYTLTFYDADGHVLSKFILNGTDTIRKDPFFYRTSPDCLGSAIQIIASYD